MDDDFFREKLDLDELYKEKKKTHDTRIKIYNKILNRVHKKIKTVARMRNNDHFCVFLLPEFVLGIPRYDMDACNSYVIEKLINNGFKIKYTHPNLLFISWEHYIPKYERASIKKKTGYSIDGFGNVLRKKKEPDRQDLNASLTNRINKQNNSKSDNDNYKKISSYKPKGNLIYGKKMLKNIEDTLNLNDSQ